jgi:hypothetical protein
VQLPDHSDLPRNQFDFTYLGGNCGNGMRLARPFTEVSSDSGQCGMPDQAWALEPPGSLSIYRSGFGRCNTISNLQGNGEEARMKIEAV